MKVMTTSRAILVLDLYRSRLRLYRRPHLVHAREMCEKAIRFFEGGRTEAKGWRWLGFIQGVLWMENIYTIDEMRQHNREP
jgi:hypothetical protein